MMNVPERKLSQVKFNNDVILTTEQLAEFYGTTSKRIMENFSRNSDKFVEGKHYFFLEGEELKAFKNYTAKSGLVGKRAPSVYLWTKRGASRHAKMLGTDRAWDVYDELEDSYFSSKPYVISKPDSYMINDPVKRAQRWIEEAEHTLQVESENKKMKPKSNYFDQQMHNPGLMTATEIAKEYGRSANWLNRYLADHGVLYHKGKQWVMKQKYADKGYSSYDVWSNPDNRDVKNLLKWTQRGKKFIYDFLAKDGIYPIIEQMHLEV